MPRPRLKNFTINTPVGNIGFELEKTHEGQPKPLVVGYRCGKCNHIMSEPREICAFCHKHYDIVLLCDCNTMFSEPRDKCSFCGKKIHGVEYSCDSVLVGRWIATEEAMMFANQVLVFNSDATGKVLDGIGGQLYFKWVTDYGKLDFAFERPINGFGGITFNYLSSGKALVLSSPDDGSVTDVFARG